MAITIGNKSNSNGTPGATSFSISHTHNVGSNSMLLVSVTMSNTVNYTTITYGGNPLTLIRNDNRTGLGQRMWTGYILTPPIGVNTLQVNFSGSQWNPISLYACSFLGVGGIGNSVRVGGLATPNNQNITVSSNSIVFTTACSINAISGFQIPTGSSRPLEFTHNTNRQVSSALSTTSAFSTAGTYQIRTTATFGNITSDSFEILEFASPPSGTNSNFFAFF